MGSENTTQRSTPANSPEGGFPLRIRWFALALVALVFGALGGAILAPQPAGAVNKDMIELQQTVSQIQQNQQDLRSTIDANNASMKTLIQQSIDSVSQMNTQMGALQKTVQQVEANTGSRIDSMAQQTQGISDNLQDVQSRVGKLSQQLTDMQNLLQSIDSKVSSGGSPAPGSEPPQGPSAGYPQTAPNGQSAGAPPSYSASNNYGPPPSYNNASPYGAAPPANTAPPAAMAPISADTLYKNALRDLTTGNYDLSRQEFTDYVKHFPSSDLASNSQFYLGEIYYAQGDYKDAITQYDLVLSNYPQSIKLSSALLKKAQAEIALKAKTTSIHDLREVVSRFPNTDDARRARSLLAGMGVPVTAPRPTH
jgi:tol-pal system protein YbgF